MDPSEVKVLLVDDEPNLLASYKRLLTNDYSVTCALGAIEALEILKADPTYGVVLSDIKMPEMDGIELLSHVRRLYPETVRLVLTGYADMNMVINAVNSGDIFRFLTKPCQSADFKHAISAAINQFIMAANAKELAVVKRVKKGLEGTLLAFIRLIEFRDPYTAGHMARTAEISAYIATKRNMSTDVVEGVKLAALVHDIGKIAVPAGILNKPNSLTDAEYTIVKTHPLVGAEILETMETPWPIQRIIREHHERLDGSGYPHGLTADEILPESKIIAVADYIDAITTNRPYRNRLNRNEVIKILLRERKSRLDPESVDIGIELLSTGSIGGSFYSLKKL
ncbi:MAG: HD domain-containing phosphohydrolase [Desulfovibrio sp.]